MIVSMGKLIMINAVPLSGKQIVLAFDATSAEEIDSLDRPLSGLGVRGIGLGAALARNPNERNRS